MFEKRFEKNLCIKDEFYHLISSSEFTKGANYETRCYVIYLNALNTSMYGKQLPILALIWLFRPRNKTSKARLYIVINSNRTNKPPN